MTYCPVVTVLALVGLTKKRFGRYSILKNLSLRSPSWQLLIMRPQLDASVLNTYSMIIHVILHLQHIKMMS